MSYFLSRKVEKKTQKIKKQGRQQTNKECNSVYDTGGCLKIIAAYHQQLPHHALLEFHSGNKPLHFNIILI